MDQINKLKQIEVKSLVWQPEKKMDPILKNVNAMLTSGDFYGILGPNGAGKTSIVRQILHLQDSSSGAVLMDDKNIKEFTRKEMAIHLSFLPQEIKSDVDFTAYDVVAMGREPHRKRFASLTEEDKEKIQEAMQFTNCWHLREKSISFMSGGERQRVMIARTIAQDTPWIILDEPVSNLDVKHQAELMVVLERLRKEKGKTIVAILHDLNLAAAFCTQIILMKKGNVFQAGPAEEVLTEENLSKVYELQFDFFENKNGKIPYIMPRFS